MKKRMMCSNCGSDRLLWDAWVDEFETLITILPLIFCEKCDGETSVIEKTWSKPQGESK